MKSINIFIEFDGETLYIAEDSSSGCKYHPEGKKEMLEDVLNYIDGENEYRVIVERKNFHE